MLSRAARPVLLVGCPALWAAAASTSKRDASEKVECCFGAKGWVPEGSAIDIGFALRSWVPKADPTVKPMGQFEFPGWRPARSQAGLI